MINPIYSLEKVTDLIPQYEKNGILVFENFLTPDALKEVQQESENLAPKMYRRTSEYNLYVKPQDPEFLPDSPRNRIFKSSKGCICMEEIPNKNPLIQLYQSEEFMRLISRIVGTEKLYPYADTLSGININYYDSGDSLGWHFDNADFTVTLLVKKPTEGGIYQYFPNQRYRDDGSEDYELVGEMIGGMKKPISIDPDVGTLMIFRGNNSLHRVTDILSGQRILVTLNYTRLPNISLSETSRMTFFGRIK